MPPYTQLYKPSASLHTRKRLSLKPQGAQTVSIEQPNSSFSMAPMYEQGTIYFFLSEVTLNLKKMMSPSCTRYQGLADTARHVTGCQMTQETRVKNMCR